MIFCPICSNCLLIEKGASNFQFYCKTCEYTFPVLETFKNVIKFQTKQVDDILGGQEAWKNVDQTDAICPRCKFGRAYQKQIQMRSADEPMTTFFKCAGLECDQQWRVD